MKARCRGSTLRKRRSSVVCPSLGGDDNNGREGRTLHQNAICGNSQTAEMRVSIAGLSFSKTCPAGLNGPTTTYEHVRWSAGRPPIAVFTHAHPAALLPALRSRISTYLRFPQMRCNHKQCLLLALHHQPADCMNTHRHLLRLCGTQVRVWRGSVQAVDMDCLIINLRITNSHGLRACAFV